VKRVLVDERAYSQEVKECYRHPQDGHLILTLPVAAKRAIIELQ
jgi:hypothetical protein